MDAAFSRGQAKVGAAGCIGYYDVGSVTRTERKFWKHCDMYNQLSKNSGYMTGVISWMPKCGSWRRRRLIRGRPPERCVRMSWSNTSGIYPVASCHCILIVIGLARLGYSPTHATAACQCRLVPESSPLPCRA